MMRLAIDARNLIHPRSGIARSIENAVQGLTGSVREIHLCLPGMLHSDFGYLGDLPGVQVHVVSRPAAAGRVWWGAVDLPAMLRRIRPCVLWAPAHKLSSAAAAVAPSVLTIHDLVWKFAPQTMRFHRRAGDALLTARALRHADRIIAVSERTAADLKAVFPGLQSKIAVIPNIVRPLPEPEDASVLRPSGIGDGYCLFVGTVEPRKNLARTIRAYLALREEVRQQMQFVIAGGLGWKTEEVRELLGNHGNGVVFLGGVSEQRLATLYAHCRFAVMPSLYEGFGYPAIEAKQFGKLLLTSRNSPMADTAGPGTVLADPLDEASIAAGFEQCLQDSGETCPQPLRAHAARFEADVIAPLLLQVLDAAIVMRQQQIMPA
jgi:glycosyltransferase involved in cell wall biosynthesis